MGPRDIPLHINTFAPGTRAVTFESVEPAVRCAQVALPVWIRPTGKPEPQPTWVALPCYELLQIFRLRIPVRFGRGDCPSRR